jgi:hypothetical protein
LLGGVLITQGAAGNPPQKSSETIVCLSSVLSLATFAAEKRLRM